MYSAHINAPDEQSIDFATDFQTLEEAEAFCRGWIQSLSWQGIPFPEIYTWTVWDAETGDAVSAWSDEEGYFRFRTG